MKRSVLSRGSILIVILLIVNMIGTTFPGAYAMSFTENEGVENPYNLESPSGVMEVQVLQGAQWTSLGFVAMDKYIRDYALPLASDIREDESLTLRFIKHGGGLSHLDHIGIGQSTLSSLQPQTELFYKLQEKDNDVIEVFESGIEVLLTNIDISQNIDFSGRIEPEVIGKAPFIYPKENKGIRMHSGSEFYVYELNSLLGQNPVDGQIEGLDASPYLFKEYDIPGSGHPRGYTYGWVMNDDNYLYAVLDFTPDNTMDGDKDYASVYIDTPIGVKQFKVSENQKVWGSPAFTYTNKVNYEHKIYEFKIPLTEIFGADFSASDQDGVNPSIKIAFDAYGTAMPLNRIDPDVAYGSKANEYLVVYQASSSTNETAGIYGQFFTYDGMPSGSTLELYPDGSDYPAGPKVAYNSIEDEFLVVWSRYNGTTDRVEGIRLDSSGNVIGSVTYLDEAQAAMSDYIEMESREFAQVAYSKDKNAYAVVWRRSGEDGYKFLEGIIIEPDLSPYAQIDFGIPDENVGTNLDLSYNGNNYSYTLAYEMETGTLTGGDAHKEIYYSEFSKYGVIQTTDTNVSRDTSDTSPFHLQPSLVHNSVIDDELVTWINKDTSELYGAYKTTSDSAIVIANNVYVGDRSAVLAKDQTSDEIMALWTGGSVSGMDTNANDVFFKLMDETGSTLDSGSINSSSDLPDSIAAASNGRGSYLIAYVITPAFGGDRQLAVSHYGSFDNGDVDFEDISLNVLEGSTADLVIERHGATDGEISVDYTIEDITTNGSDYSVETTSGTAIFANGQQFYTLSIPTFDDSDEEEVESFEVTLSNLTGNGALKTDTVATVTITDNDGAESPTTTISINSTMDYIVEEGMPITIYVDRTGDLTGSVSVSYEVTSGTAIESDYVYDKGTLVFEDQQDIATLTVQTAWDETYEGDETFNVILSDASSGAMIDNDTAVVTIVEDEMDLGTGDYEPDVAYGAVLNNYLLVFEHYDESFGGSAIIGRFYNNTGEKIGEDFDIVEMSDTYPADAQVVYNQVDDEFLIMWIEDYEGMPTAHFKVLDSDGTEIIADTRISTSAYEEHDEVTAAHDKVTNTYLMAWEYYDFELYQEGIGGVLFDGDRSFTSLPLDSSKESHDPKVVYNSSSSEFVVTYVAVDDKKPQVVYVTVDGDGTITTPETGVTYSTYGQKDPVISHNSRVEDDYVLWIEDTNPNSIVGQYKTTSGSAVTLATSEEESSGDPSAFMDLTNMRLFWIEKVNNNAVPYFVKTQEISDEGIFDGNAMNVDSDVEPFDGISAAYDYESEGYLVAYGHMTTSAGAIRVAYLDVSTDGPLDPNQDPEINMDKTSISVEEGQTASVTVKRTGDDLSGSDTVTYVLSDQTSSGSDYTEPSGTLTFAMDETEKTIEIPTINDGLHEENESFTVTLTSVSGTASIGSSDTTSVTIKDINDEIEFATNTMGVEEGQDLVVTLIRMGNQLGTDEVTYTFSTGSAGQEDYINTGGSVTFEPGQSSKEIVVSTIDDTDVENSEDFTMTLNGIAGESILGSQKTLTVTISDNDGNSTMNFASETAMAEEGQDVTLTVVRTGSTAGTDTVSYETITGTTSELDHAIQSGTLTFIPGETVQTITISSTDDNEVETDETFTVSLTQPTGNAVLGSMVDTVVTLYDNDVPTVEFNLSTLSVNEGDTATVVLTLSEPFEKDITIYYDLTHGTAGASDVATLSGSVTFEAGQTEKTISIPTIEDSVVELNEVFAVEITANIEGYIGERSVITITIRNDDVRPDRRDNDNNNDTNTTNNTSTSGTSTQNEQDNNTRQEIEDLANTISNALSSAEPSMSANVATEYLESMERSIDSIEDEAALTGALDSYINTLNVVTKLNVADPTDEAAQAEQEKWVESQVVKISDVVTKSIQKITSDESIVNVTKKVIDQIKQVELDTNVKKTAEVKNKVASLAQSVLTKVSEVKVKQTVEVVDDVSKVSFDQAEVAQKVAEKAVNFKTLSDSFNEYYGAENVRKFDFEVTLVTERVSNKVQVPIDKETINTLNASGVDALSVAVGGTTVKLKKEVYAEELEEGAEPPEIVVDMDFSDQGFEVRDEKVNFKKGVVTDVKVFLDQEERKKLNKPVELKFKVDDFEFWEEDYKTSSLSIFRLNEETDEWEPVGGRYDPVTNTVRTNRLTLSQYTVMQSNKSFADVENSWAKDEINELLGKGIIDEAENFNPEEKISREEFTTWVARAYGVVDDEAESPFTDVDESSEHYEELASAYNAGIVSGGGDGSFNPDSSVTKEQMSAILANAMTQYDDKQLNEEVRGVLASASDADLISDWADDDIALLIELGVIDGESGAINPKQELSKEEAASILKKIYG